MQASVRGFTLVEVLVAIVLLTGGILTTVAALGTVTRMVTTGRGSTMAAALGSGQLELLRSRGCPPAGSGEQSRGSHVVAWAVASVTGGRRLTVVVTSGPPPGRVHAISTLVACP